MRGAFLHGDRTLTLGIFMGHETQSETFFCHVYGRRMISPFCETIDRASASLIWTFRELLSPLRSSVFLALLPRCPHSKRGANEINFVKRSSRADFARNSAKWLNNSCEWRQVRASLLSTLPGVFSISRDSLRLWFINLHHGYLTRFGEYLWLGIRALVIKFIYEIHNKLVGFLKDFKVVCLVLR